MKKGIISFAMITNKFEILKYLLSKIKNNYKFFHLILFDIWIVKKSTKIFRLFKIKNSANKTITILNYDDNFFYQIKIFGYLIQGLRKQGWNIKIILKNKLNIFGILYFKCFGINDFEFFDSFKLDKNEKEFCRKNANLLIGNFTSLSKIKKLTFDEVWIGPQIIASISRDIKEANLNFRNNKLKKKLYSETKTCIKNILIAKKIFKKIKIQKLLTNELNNSFYGPLIDIAIKNNIEVIVQTQPWKDDGLILRKVNKENRREHPSSLSKRTLDKIFNKEWTKKEDEQLFKIFNDRYSGKWFLQARNQINTKNYDLNLLQEKYNLDKSKKIAVIFSQVLWDANLFYGNDLFEDAGDWFLNTISEAIENSNVNWLIKIHPANIWKRNLENINSEYAEVKLIHNNFGKLPSHVKIIFSDDNINTLSLFKIIDYGVTIRGTSGIEMSCFGKPCITAGTGRYSNLGFTLDSKNKKDYLSKIRNIQLFEKLTQKQINLAKWFAYASFYLRILDIKGAEAKFNYQKKGRHPFDHDLKIKYKNIDEITKNCDLIKFANWVESENIDYIKHI